MLAVARAGPGLGLHLQPGFADGCLLLPQRTLLAGGRKTILLFRGMPVWAAQLAAGFAGSSAPSYSSSEKMSWVLLTHGGLQRHAAKAGIRYPDQRKPSRERGSGVMLEAGVLQEMLLSHPAPSHTNTSPLLTLWGIFASSEVQKIARKAFGHLHSSPLFHLCLLLLSFPFSFSFKVNLSDCYNVIVFLAPSVVSQSLAP